MSTQYLFVGDHAETLASGQRVAPGDDPLPVSAVDTLSDVDQRLIAAGTLIELGQSGDEDLSRLGRAELDARARALGIDEPEQLPNKDAVLAAIADKENSP